MSRDPQSLQAIASEKQDGARQLLKSTSEDGIIAQLTSNPFFTAGFGLAGLGAAAAFARRGVRQGAGLLKRRLLVDLEISRNDESYQWFLHWMSQHHRARITQLSVPPANQAKVLDTAESDTAKQTLFRRLVRRFTPGLHHLSIQTSTTNHPNGALNTHFSLVPGPGRHILRYKNTWIAVDRVRKTESIDLNTGTPWETVTLTTLYSQRHIFEDLFAEAHRLAVQLKEGKTIVYTPWGNDWRSFGEPRRKRPLESVILDEGVKEKIVDDIKGFLASSQWYIERGIPYRRGYLLHGPPGTGKTSFISALAGELDYNIALLNLSERGLTDDKLNHLLKNTAPRTIVLLEDADVAFVNRRVQTEPDGYRGANVTFSGLLNALDGVASAEERIIFLTTNHVERLDDAFIRPGRVDMSIRLGEASRWQMTQLWNRFYGDIDKDQTGLKVFLSRVEQLGMISSADGIAHGQSYPVSTAALQGLFLYNKGDMQGAIDMAENIRPRLDRQEQATEVPRQQARSS